MGRRSRRPVGGRTRRTRWDPWPMDGSTGRASRWSPSRVAEGKEGKTTERWPEERERARQMGSRSKPAGQQRSKARSPGSGCLQKKLMGAEYQTPAKKRSLKTEGCSGWNPCPRCRKTGQPQTKGRPGCGSPSQLN